MRACKSRVQWLVGVNVLVLVMVIFLVRERSVLESFGYTFKAQRNPLLLGTSPNSTNSIDRIGGNSSTNEEAVNRDGMTMLMPGVWIHSDWHPKLRSERFPSVAQRIKIYMSNWYHPPCMNSTKLSQYILERRSLSFDSINLSIDWPRLTMRNPWDPDSPRNMTFDCIITPDTKFLLDRRVVYDCARDHDIYVAEGERLSESRIKFRKNMHMYCVDSLELLDYMEHADNKTANSSTPILVLFGDNPGVFRHDPFDIPFFAKFRAATSPEYMEHVTGGNVATAASSECRSFRKPLLPTYHHDVYHNKLSPILWKFASARHWLPLKHALKVDIPWEQKKNLAFWAGAMTGTQLRDSDEPECGADESCSFAMDVKKCQANQRCNFVLNHVNSSLIDCGLTGIMRLSSGTVNGTNLLKNYTLMQNAIKYKVLVSLEGNDVSSGLKWMLQSQSVVLMPPPTRTSWAMEELLEPWVHYIPMYSNGSNAEEMVQWVLDNDDEARKIAERATLFMYDMLYHPDADEDEFKVKKNIIRRYQALWQ